MVWNPRDGEDPPPQPAVGSTPLENLKFERMAAIDERTREMVDDGFAYGDPPVVCSLSNNAQLRMTNLAIIAESPMTTYPILWSGKLDDAHVVLNDSTEAMAFYATALGTMRAIIDSGTVLKNQVRAATTIAEVNAVVDNR